MGSLRRALVLLGRKGLSDGVPQEFALVFEGIELRESEEIDRPRVVLHFLLEKPGLKRA